MIEFANISLRVANHGDELTALQLPNLQTDTRFILNLLGNYIKRVANRKYVTNRNTRMDIKDDGSRRAPAKGSSIMINGCGTLCVKDVTEVF